MIVFLSSRVLSPSGCTVPHGPFRGGRTLDAWRVLLMFVRLLLNSEKQNKKLALI